MKQKHILTAIVTAAILLGLAVPALAAVPTKSISVETDVKVFVDDKTLDAGDTHGNPDCFIYNGTTYVAAAAVSKSLGQDVMWDGSTRSVHIVSPIDNSTSGSFYVPETRFMVGNNVLTSDKIKTATNWTSNGSTLTHTAGSSEPLRIAMGNLAVAGDEWLITFDCPSINGNVLYLSFGSEAKTSTYNGLTSIAVALRVKENGDDLLLTPTKSFAGTLSNFKIQKISESGTELYEFESNSLVNMEEQIAKTGFWNVILGTEHTMTNAINSTRTIAIGHSALHELQTGNRNIGIGTYAMSQLENGEQNISIGADSMFEVKSGDRNIVLGKGAASRGTRLTNNIALGDGAMAGGHESNANLNIVLGMNAALNLGKSSSSTSENTARNIVMGYGSAQNMTTGTANVYIGDQITAANGKNQNVVIGASAKATGDANRSIAIGYQAQATKANQCVIGSPDITEVIVAGKKISFNEDGTVTWSPAQ